MKEVFFSLFILLFSESVLAEDSIWKIKTKRDSFSVVRNDQGYFIGNEKINFKAFQWFRDFIDTETAQDECPSLTLQPDVEVTKTKGDFTKTVKIYMSEKVIQVDDNCSQLKGDGIYRFPLVRAWYLGSEELTIGIPETRKLELGSMSLSYKTQDGRYFSLDSDIVPNWNKIAEFEKSLKNFEVTGRRRMEYSIDKRSFDFTAGDKTYTFYEVLPRVWAVKFPDTQWLIVSKSFNWGDFDETAFKHPQSSAISTFLNKKKSQDQRLGALTKMKSYWDQTVQNAYVVVLNDEDDDVFVRKEASEQLIKKPSKETKKILGLTLITTNNAELISHLSRRLQLYNRDGKTIDMNDDEETAETKMKTWRKWVDSL